MTTILFPKDGARFSLQNDRQKTFAALRVCEGEERQKKLDWLKLERSNNADCTFPEKIIVTFETDQSDPVLLLSESEFMTSAEAFPTENGTAVLNNLKVNTRYFIKVADSTVVSFTTEDEAPRWMEVDGLSNIRDAGGWKTEDGRHIRQGCIYRGGEMDTHQTITEKGIRMIRESLKIRTDLDLRGEAVGRVTESPAGADINFVLIPTAAYKDVIEQDQNHHETLRRLFELFADETAYPIYYHCWGGADRTGTIAFLLGAVLGVPEDDLILDYELTSLSIWGGRSHTGEYSAPFFEKFQTFGSTAKERAENVLRCAGVTDETIARLRANLIEDDPRRRA